MAAECFLCNAEPKTSQLFTDFCQSGGIVSSCSIGATTQIYVDCAVAVAFLYFAVTCFLLMRKLRVFNSLPYDKTQSAIVFIRLQVSRRATICAQQMNVSSGKACLVFQDAMKLDLAWSIITILPQARPPLHAAAVSDTQSGLHRKCNTEISWLV